MTEHLDVPARPSAPRAPRPAMIAPESYASLGELLRDALVQFKTHTALVELDRRRESARLTYLDVKRTSERLARRLELLGVGPDDRVAILMTNQSKWLIAACAVLFRGAVLVPIDYKLTAGEQAALLAHCRPKLLVTEHPLFRRFREAPAPAAILTDAPAGFDGSASVLAWDAAIDVEGAPSFAARTRDDVATIVYSSGTGGQPKGCMLTHDNYLEQLRALSSLFPLTSGDRYFSILPTNHAIDFMVGFLGPFSGGATVVHQRTLRPELILETMRSQRITHMSVVPLVLEAFERGIREKLDARPEPVRRLFGSLAQLNATLTRKKPQHALSRALLKPVHDAFGGELRVLFCGGAFVDRERAQFFYDLGIPVVIGYGLTEACTVATVNDLSPFRADSVGRAVGGVEVRIHAPDAGGVGEVWVRGRTVMRGYLDDPELTAETIDPEGWLHTGDLGWLDASNHLHLVGRCKNMVVTAGGKNVYPEDVEAAFEGVPCEELVVTASGYVWPGERLTDERLLVVARLRAGEPPAALVEALRAKNQRLPDYKRAGGVLVAGDAFPRTASMKVKRGELAARLREVHPRGLASLAESPEVFFPI